MSGEIMGCCDLQWTLGNEVLWMVRERNICSTRGRTNHAYKATANVSVIAPKKYLYKKQNMSSAKCPFTNADLWNGEHNMLMWLRSHLRIIQVNIGQNSILQSCKENKSFFFLQLCVTKCIQETSTQYGTLNLTLSRKINFAGQHSGLFFLCGVCMFSLCSWGLPPSTL